MEHIPSASLKMAEEDGGSGMELLSVSMADGKQFFHNILVSIAGSPISIAGANLDTQLFRYFDDKSELLKHLIRICRKKRDEEKRNQISEIITNFDYYVRTR